MGVGHCAAQRAVFGLQQRIGITICHCRGFGHLVMLDNWQAEESCTMRWYSSISTPMAGRRFPFRAPRGLHGLRSRGWRWPRRAPCGARSAAPSPACAAHRSWHRVCGCRHRFRNSRRGRKHSGVAASSRPIMPAWIRSSTSTLGGRRRPDGRQCADQFGMAGNQRSG